MSKCRVQMSISRYKEIYGKITSHSEGLLREEIDKDYVLMDNEFVLRQNIDEMISSKTPPLGIAAKDPSDESEKFKNWIATNSGFIEGCTSMASNIGSNQTILSRIQRYIVDTPRQFIWMNKCRQFGFSFSIACKGLAKCMLSNKSTSICVSYNEEESKEKIVYAHELYDSLPTKYKLGRRLKYDNKRSLVWEKMGQDSTETRLLSYPQRIIRGKGGDVDVSLDELGHCIHAKQIYTSAIPVLSRGNSSLLIGSTPAGKGGLFYEIGENFDNHYSTYVRIIAPWWTVPEFCIDLEKAKIEAPVMFTDQRVERFATDRLKAIRNSMTLDDFQQEYECEFLDESYAYFPRDLIMSNVPVFDVDGKGIPDYDAPASDLSSIDDSKVGIDYYTDFDEFLEAINKGKVGKSFLGGFDVGRTSDASEIIFVEEHPVTHAQTVRCNITLKNMRLPDQREYTKNVVEKLGHRLKKFGVDDNGIGRNIAEDLEDLSYEIVQRLPFNSNEWKEEACRRFKYRLETSSNKDAKMIILPLDKKLINQIHSIKRTLLPSGVWRFDVEKNNKHHGDKFWALVAASEMGFPITENDMLTDDLDKRIIPAKENKVNRVSREKSHSDIIVNDHLIDIVKFNPWNNDLKGLPVPSIPFKIPSLS